MAQKKKKKKKKKTTNTPKSTKSQINTTEPWISMRTAVIVITLLSVAMFIFVMWTTRDAGTDAMADRVRYALVRGGSIWVIFLLVYFFNRYIRNR